MKKFSASERVALANEALAKTVGRSLVGKRHSQVKDIVFIDSIPAEFISLDNKDL